MNKAVKKAREQDQQKYTEVWVGLIWQPQQNHRFSD